MARTVVLLGPQRLHPILVHAFDELGLEGPIAAVTAGWQEREAEVEEMREHLGRPVVNLRLYARADQLFATDTQLAAAYRRRQDVLRELQELYRLRLSHIVRPARELLAREGDAKLLEPERQAAIASVRDLDRHHRQRLAELHAEFDLEIKVQERPALLRHRHDLAKLLGGCSALAIAGGHVAILLNRLRLFGVLELAGPLPIFAWSAGAMVLGSQVVIFHDNPPQGAAAAEVLELGLGVYDDLLPFPHAARRLELESPRRVALLARRFAPQICLALDPKTRLIRRGGGWKPSGEIQRMTELGTLEPMKGA
jgi:hypothetical protein